MEIRRSGLFILHKEEGMTSQSAVSRVRRLFGADKAGHTGTLDPMATGVLPILLGRAAKASDYLITSQKHYRATLLLGLTTDTEDTTGTTLTTFDGPLPDEEAVLQAVASFLGEQMQIPPMYSALKQGGKKLCDLARAGQTVAREARPITVYSIKAKRLSEAEYDLDVLCSKGTYIRTLCADIGKALGCGGAMKALCRLSAAGYTLKDAKTLGELAALSEEQRAACLIPTEALFPSFSAISLPPFFSRLAHSGAEIYLKKIGLSAAVGDRFRLYDEKGFFAIGETREYEEGLAIKPIKQFV